MGAVDHQGVGGLPTAGAPLAAARNRSSHQVKSCGHNADQASLAPNGFITGAELKWGTVYTEYAGPIAKGEKLPNINEGGYDKDMVASTAFGKGATEEAIAAATAAMAEVEGGAPIFVGPLKDNTGKVVIEGTLRTLRRLALGHRLPARRHRRLDHLKLDVSADRFEDPAVPGSFLLACRASELPALTSCTKCLLIH